MKTWLKHNLRTAIGLIFALGLGLPSLTANSLPDQANEHAQPRFAAGGFVDGELIIKFKEGVPPGRTQQLLSEYGFSQKNRASQSSLHTTNGRPVPEVLAELAGNPDIEYAQPNYIYTAISIADDPELPRQWNLDNSAAGGLGDIQATEAWPLESPSHRVVVAVIDTGINYLHEDLIDNMWVNVAEATDGLDNDGNGTVDDFVYFDAEGRRRVNVGELVPDATNNDSNTDIYGNPMVDDFFGFDYVVASDDDLIEGEQPSFDNNPMDRDGENHGTGVAGVLAAVRNNARQIAGVTSSAEIMALRFARRVEKTDPVSGETYFVLEGNTASLVACMHYAIDNGADIINVSSQGTYPDPAYQAVIARAYEEGILVVSGISNGSIDVDNTTLDIVNNQDGSPVADGIPDNASYPANFTFDYAPADGKIDDDNLLIVTATSRSDSLSSYASYGGKSVDIGAPGDLIPTLKADGSWGYTSGISVAVPHVSGVAAMILANEPGLDPVALKYRIMANGDRVSSLNSTTVSGGRVNAYKAMTGSTTGNQPDWWTAEDTRIIQPGRIPDNYAPVTLGQLKHVAQQARDYLEIPGHGGAGTDINAVVDAFATYDQSDPIFDPQNYYAPANLGQLKALAKPFYDRLAELQYNTKTNLILRGYPVDWGYDTPWDPNTPVVENYAMANLGQLKMVFSFDLANNGFVDTDGDYIYDYKDADPNDAQIGELKIAITYPLGGSI